MDPRGCPTRKTNQFDSRSETSCPRLMFYSSSPRWKRQSIWCCAKIMCRLVGSWLKHDHVGLAWGFTTIWDSHIECLEIRTITMHHSIWFWRIVPGYRYNLTRETMLLFLRKLLGKGSRGHFLEELNLSENSFWAQPVQPVLLSYWSIVILWVSH